MKDKLLEIQSKRSEVDAQERYYKGMKDTLQCFKSLLHVLRRCPHSETSGKIFEDALEKCAKSLKSKFGINLLGDTKVKRLSQGKALCVDSKKSAFVSALLRNGFKVKDAAISIGCAERVASREGDSLLRDEGVRAMIGDIILENSQSSMANLEEMLQSATQIMRAGAEDKDKLQAIKVLGQLYGIGEKSTNQVVNVGMGVVSQTNTVADKITIIKFE